MRTFKLFVRDVIRANQTHEIAEQAVTGARLLAPRSVTNHLPAALRAVAALQLRNQKFFTHEGTEAKSSGPSKLGTQTGSCSNFDRPRRVFVDSWTPARTVTEARFTGLNRT